MKRIKRIVSIILSVAIMLTLAVPGMAQETVKDTTKEQPIMLSSTVPEKIIDLATAYLKNAKETMYSDAPAMGFNQTEFSELALGTPFTIYNFDENGILLSDDTYCCPLLYNGQVSATILMRYLPQTQQYSYTFGKVYADSLNSIQTCRSLNTRQSLAVGAMDGVLFVTDGQKVEPIFYENAEVQKNFRSQNLQAVSATMYAQTDKTGVAMTDVIAMPMAEKKRASNRAVNAYPNPLPVTVVQQIGNQICGVCAWATVLNYRFGTSYTYDTLKQGMASNYWNGQGSNGTLAPTMQDYRNYANDVHSAGCVFHATPISFSAIIAAIDSRRPIMGNWKDGNRSPAEYHAINIVGYQSFGTGYYYYISNPWYTYIESISVTQAANAVYSTGSHTWVLVQAVC